jgi:hypothetical protein
MNETKENPERRFRRSHKIVSIWLFGDVAYTVLPIGTIAIINVALNQPMNKFFLMPEWSFASIVFYGLTIRHLVDLKVHYQKDLSYKLDTGTQFYILLLIGSVLTLSLVVLSEKGLVANPKLLVTLQIVLFLIGLFSLLIAVVFKNEYIETRLNLPTGIYKRRYFSYLKTGLDSALDTLNYVDYAIAKSKSITVKPGNDFVNSKVWDEEQYSKLDATLTRIEQRVPELRSSLNALRTEPPRVMAAPSE